MTHIHTQGMPCLCQSSIDPLDRNEEYEIPETTHIYNPELQGNERSVLLEHAATQQGVFRFLQEKRTDQSLQQSVPRVLHILSNAIGNHPSAEIHLHLLENEYGDTVIPMNLSE